MRRMLGLAALLVACGAVITACDDRAPTTPLTRASLAPKRLRGAATTTTTATDTSQVVTVLKRSVKLREDIVQSWVVDERETELSIPSLGFVLDIERGALSGPTLITVRAPGGEMGELVTYEFEPHGLQFLQGVQIKQDLRYTNAYGKEVALHGGYFRDSTAVDPSTETATITESYPVTLDVTRSLARFDIRHFSGYLLASGRQ